MLHTLMRGTLQMAIENEFKYLVHADKKEMLRAKLEAWTPSLRKRSITQFYITDTPCRVRKLVEGGEVMFVHTTKHQIGDQVYEFEIPITEIEFNIISKKSKGFFVEKDRYDFVEDGKTWEVDFFKSDNYGVFLAVIEVEVEPTVTTHPELPKALRSYSVRNIKQYDYSFHNSNMSSPTKLIKTAAAITEAYENGRN